MEENNISLSDLLKILRNRLKLIVIITIVSTLVTAIACFYFIDPKYEASSKLFIGKEQGEKDENYNYNDVELYQKLIKTYSDVIMTKDLVDNSLSGKNIDESSGTILKNLSVTPKTDTQLIEIKYTDKDRFKANDIVAAITDEFVTYSKELIPNANVKIVQKVILPENPVSPNKPIYIALGFIIGALVSVILAILLELMDNTFKDRKQVEEILDLPVLGNVPCIN
ncbi:Wzz/FepE/Etk N-terminal domain-containing protein [Clostridium sp. SHJSY1]|uniref:YveK family protein n=1 Tax=Clostridium sp. SHJSY1 TaxID=2942483 RepID=UPI0028768758|nr:Wzz/FepE/Etk N-terminal domain-containing protein [Clostridium sp. SHJSY1]MDS0526515.1 Wzz/FepE/Etk N-terminal domain-containing protein [Clostridium sp. SHJSY1]